MSEQTQIDDQELTELERKTHRNELRARDAEARLRIVMAEMGIIEQREKLSTLKQRDS